MFDIFNVFRAIASGRMPSPLAQIFLEVAYIS